MLDLNYDHESGSSVSTLHIRVTRECAGDNAGALSLAYC